MANQVPFPAVGEFLKRQRLAKGFYPDDLARRLGIHRDYLDALERGEKLPPWSLVREIGKELGFNPNELGKIAAGYFPTREQLLEYEVPDPTPGS